jgi:hypothetical protein
MEAASAYVQHYGLETVTTVRIDLIQRWRPTMTALALILSRIDHGWAVRLTNGRELVRFTGLGARFRARRWVAGLGVSKEAIHVG